MMRRCAWTVAAVLSMAAFVLAGEAMEAKGKVKTVEANSLTVTAADGTDWSFEASPATVVVARGATHKMDDLGEKGKPSVISEFVKEKATVTVKYSDKDGKHMIEELRVH